jgi:hypothetical protein
MIFEQVLHNNGYDTVEVSALVPVSFPDTRSGILGANGSMARCCTTTVTTRSR